MPEDPGFFGMRNTKQTVSGGGGGDGDGSPPPHPPTHLWHGSHGWTQNSWELSREAADQAINAESTKSWAVGENRSPFLLPEVFVFMVHYVYCVQTCSRPLIRSAHSQVTDHEYTNSSFYYCGTFLWSPEAERLSNFMTISCFLVASHPISFISCCEWI